MVILYILNQLDIKLQINAFKEENWLLALVEYGENWRTNAIKQIKTNDVIFLFQRGGAGYVGAFRASGEKPYKILDNNDNDPKVLEKYDIYEGLSDGASLCSNVLVEPIAYNYKGVGYYTVRRRTIERMNDMEAVKYLLRRLKGEELVEERKNGKDYLDENQKVDKLNNDYFSKICSELKV